MSLYALADQMAAKGRNGDSVLVHMTPGEVQGLQALAMANGGSLTINPETGLPEANFLKKLLPMIAGAALGPAGFGVFSSALGAAGAVGGFEALRTGSLSRGLAAGLGAYGGASLASGLAGAGAGAEGAAGALGVEGAGTAAGSQAAMLADQMAGFGSEGLQHLAGGASYAAGAAPSMSSALAAGTKALGTEAGRNAFLANMGGGSKALSAGLMAAVPAMLADKGVTTKTQMPGDTGYIRQFSFDPYTQQYVPIGVYPASEYGKEPPPGMADGGIVALADGGSAAYEWWKGQGKTPDEYYGYLTQKIGEMPNMSRQQIDTAMQQYGISNEDVAEAMRRSGMSQATQWSALSGPQGLAGMNENIRAAAERALEDPSYTRETAEKQMRMYGINEADVQRATGMGLADIFANRPVNIPETTTTNLPIAPTGPNETYTKEDVTKGWFGGTGEPVVGVKEFDPTGRIQRPIPRDIAQHEEWYNRLTGGSQQAYDYLMGRGAYPTKPVTASGALFRPYGEVVLGQPATSFNTPFIFDPQTRTYKPNPNYKKPEGIKPTVGGAGSTTGAGTAGTVDPRSMFDEASYLEANPDVADEIRSGKANFGDAYGHFLRYGLAEGRQGGVPDINAFKKALEEWERSQQAGSGASPGDAFGGTSSGDTGSGGFSGMSNSGEGGEGSVGGWRQGGSVKRMALGGLGSLAVGGTTGYDLGTYSDGGRLLKGPGDGVSDSIPATIGGSRPARLADGEFVVPARIVSEIGNGSTDAGARKLYAMMDRVQRARGKTVGKGKVAKDTNADKYLPA